MPAERLQKVIAAAGVASRRKAEELITGGRVVVNGQVVTQLGTKADPDQDHIRVDGKLIQAAERFIYVALNKPKGYVTTVSDEKKRPTVMDLVTKVKGRVYPVGRLDWASEGLILMTNDGTLANALMKASSNVEKIYVVKVAGQPDEGKLDKLRRGVSIAEKGGRRVRTAPAKIRLIREGDNPWLEVAIIEGRNRQVRKMFEEVGHHVEKIRRVQYGPLALDVPPGDWRNLTLLEVAKLKSAASGIKTVKVANPMLPVATKAAKALYREKPARPFKSAKPQFAKSEKPQFAKSARPQFAKPPRPQFTKSAEPKFAKSANTQFAKSAKPHFAKSTKPKFAESTKRQFAAPARQGSGIASPRPSRTGYASGSADRSDKAWSARTARPSRPSGSARSARPTSSRADSSRPSQPARSASTKSSRPAYGSRASGGSRRSGGSQPSRGSRPPQGSRPSRPSRFRNT